MTGPTCDIAVIGGGLSGGLIALALARHRPDRTIMLLESGETLGGNHRWSWFASDLSPAGSALMEAFPVADWNGYDVRFPAHARHLPTAYHSLASTDFAAVLEQALPAGAIRTGCRVDQIDAAGITLADGTRIAARAVVDCRGFAPTPHLSGGWQVFLGQHLHTRAPHGLAHPVIMDATVDQLDGYRFVYVLPLGPSDLFVEDTYYNDQPDLDRDALRARLAAYCAQHGWSGEIMAEETGVLPVITGGNFDVWQRGMATPGVARAGAGGGFVHPLTSYTLPFAVDTALAIAAKADLAGLDLARLIERRARAHWRQTRFFRLLGAMLFGAARPDHRFRVFERFYRLPAGLIERFYAALPTGMDKARVLCGKPPVPVSRAIRALAGSQATLGNM